VKKEKNMATRQDPPPEEEYYEEGEEELPELPAGEPQTFTDTLVAKTPYWVISTFSWSIILGFFALVWGSGVPKVDDDAVVVSPPRKPRQIPEMEKPKDLDPNKKVLDNPKKTDDPIFRKVEEADHNESDDDEEFKKMKGDSLDFVSDKPFKGKGTYDTIGGGGGGGGRYGGRLGGKQDLVNSGGGGSDTEDAVLQALKWLSRHQEPDGSWRVKDYVGQCNQISKYATGGKCAPNPGEDHFQAGVTGLSILAFLGAGYSHLSKDTYDGICFGTVVKKGLRWMIDAQDTEGCIGDKSVTQYMYNHLICALALSEAYGLTGSPLFQSQAQRAVDFTVAAQNPDSGWRYSYKCGDNDSSVTGWAAMVLKSSELSGLQFPQSGYAGTIAWFDEVTEDTYYRVGYTHKGTGKVYVPGLNEQFEHHESLTAIAVMSRIFVEKKRGDRKISGGCELLVRDLPKWDGNWIDFYYWYYASLALFQFDGPKGPKWGSWNKAMKDALVKNQNVGSSGCKVGSWETEGRWCGEGGRVYGTAINALTLEVYYRYANVFGTGK
jgi:hypothetical protein